MEEILDFLNTLKENNHREWMEANKKDYQSTKKLFEELVHNLIARITQFDRALTGLEPKQAIFRIHRDIRFSKDKTPYKINMGASLTEGGRKGMKAGYYFQIQPEGGTMVAGGLYMPPADILAKVRQEIDYGAKDLRKVIDAPDFKKEFGEIWGERLKRAPKSYSPDHPDIDLLQLKTLIVVKNYKDKEVLQSGFVDKVIGNMKQIKPFNDFLNLAFD